MKAEVTGPTVQKCSLVGDALINLHRCREILGSDCLLTDEQIELLRDQLAALADVTLEAGIEKHRNGATGFLDTVVSFVPEEQREEICERASIMEFEGGLGRAEAEKAALGSLSLMRADLRRIN